MTASPSEPDSAAAAFDAQVGHAEPIYLDPADHDAPRLGADSLLWKFYGDMRQVLGFQRLAGTENAIGQLGQGVLDHSKIFSDLLGRARRTVPPIMSAVYGSDPHAWGRQVRDYHRTIKGTMDDGSRYHALNPELFYWAHATFVDQVLYVTDTFIRRLSDAEKEQIFRESMIWYSLYGVSARSQPQTYAQFQRYWDDMLDRFVPHKTVRYGTGYLRKGLPRPRRIPAPVWRIVSIPLDAAVRLVVIGTLPPQLREVCDLPWNERQERRFQRFAAAVRALNPVVNRLPMRWLYVECARAGWEREGIDPRSLHNRAAPQVGGAVSPPAVVGAVPKTASGSSGT
ncbi:oxygenase MpaB family protein [Millisia brevis]|uniref:oxygenase MpaB family protein n=1 Tax=Millisia brevis TaxID=264148 RepID=UPI000A06A1AD|nr:oxygenase MpaB family protein [Millisia brevis]